MFAIVTWIAIFQLEITIDNPKLAPNSITNNTHFNKITHYHYPYV
ncbi:hypothetical protein XNC1_3263 [Xenorhabdus nematophila ATCC 19061]|uniref:Uncharacterized protein n=1 Tax=Xenorhabdus nematophila (strain ATCC 19061 / DSM 3370 / CCUG 14189 / LMG 1036 / NCIMB 9965 / AN6) TaxID=406817 RepID=D3VLI9_XENNA|nr:hypothetical protein XNC1_3263 [Xenorhabdus nematophila ATCC 19061]